MTLSVYFPYPEVGDDDYTFLTARLQPDIVLHVGSSRPDPAAYEILVEGRPSRDNIEASPHLHTLLIPWAGLPTTTRHLMRDYPHIAVHNIHHNAVITAEMMMALLLSAAKFVVPVDRDFRRHDWTIRYTDNPSVVLEGKTALILGYGSIGQKVARMCQGFGMNILAIRRNHHAARDDIAAEIHPPDALHDLLPRAHVVMICLPQTDETEGWIGVEELSLLPEHAILVNAGRGLIVDQQAFYEALKAGRLYAAGSDVWYTYPRDTGDPHNTPPGDYPFHELDNLVMSPHRGGGSVETSQRRMQALADMLNIAARGEPLPNRVNLEAGY